MPSFSFRGRGEDGELVEGALDATSAELAAAQLRERRITPLDITPAQASAVQVAPNALFKPRVTDIDVMFFSRQIYTLLKAGVPIMRALTGLQESATNPAMQDLLQQVRVSLDSGRELSQCLSLHPKVFSNFYISMVRVAELTGRLEEVFLSLFHHLEFENFMRDQVKAALRYPSFVLIAMAAAVVIVNIFVIPAFAKVFKGFGVDLPLMTRMLIGFSEFMLDFGVAIAVALVAALFAFRAWIATAGGRFLWDRHKLHLPIAGKIVEKATLARFARSLSLAMKSGVPVAQALSVVAQTVDNAYISSKVGKMRDSVERGDTILRSASATGVFTPVVLQMIAVGEESGAIDDLMDEVAQMYQREVEYDLKNLSQQIEPILILVLGGLVLILALGIFLPIWDLGRAAIRH